MAWLCSNPERDDRATGTASNGSTASPVPASSRRRSLMHTPRERLQVPPEKLAWPNASLAKLDGQSVQVKYEGPVRLAAHALRVPHLDHCTDTL